MRIARGVWVVTVVLAAAAACSHGGDGSFPRGDDEGGAPHYDGGGETRPSRRSGTTATAGEARATESGARARRRRGREPGAGGRERRRGRGEGEAGDVAHEAGVEAEARRRRGRRRRRAVDAPRGGGRRRGGRTRRTETSSRRGRAAPTRAATRATTRPRSSRRLRRRHRRRRVRRRGQPGHLDQRADLVMTWDATNLYVAIDEREHRRGQRPLRRRRPGRTARPAGRRDERRALRLDRRDHACPSPRSSSVYAHDGYTEARTRLGRRVGQPGTRRPSPCATTRRRRCARR